MSGDFYTLAEGLSAPELQAVAAELLRELEGVPGGSHSLAGDEDAPSPAPSPPKLTGLLRELRAAPDGGALRGALPGNVSPWEDAGTEKALPANAGVTAAPGAPVFTARRRAAELYRQSAEGAMEAGGAPTDLEALSEAFRRDSRRYDAAYERY